MIYGGLLTFTFSSWLLVCGVLLSCLWCFVWVLFTVIYCLSLLFVCSLFGLVDLLLGWFVFCFVCGLCFDCVVSNLFFVLGCFCGLVWGDSTLF